MTNRFADAIRTRLRTVHDRLRADGAPVDLATLWLHTLPSPHPDAGDLIDTAQAELRAKWTKILDLPPGARRVRLSTAELAERVRRSSTNRATAGRWPGTSAPTSW
ncbi:hypothetical protein O1M54_47915 [Streptomyces diastatochromogenes]|nr:hypothetical protein [Streptomyces diastatochromogenes]